MDQQVDIGCQISEITEPPGIVGCQTRDRSGRVVYDIHYSIPRVSGEGPAVGDSLRVFGLVC